MDKLEFIKKALEYDLLSWQKDLEEEENAEIDTGMKNYYRGAVASLEALKAKINFILESEKKDGNKTS